MILFKIMEKKITKLERNIEKKQKQIEKLRIEWKKHRVTVYYFIYKKERIEEKINIINLKIKVLREEMTEKKKHMEEKSHKREEGKRREKNYFEWSKKYENIKN